jgi:hypothetical protein
VKDRCGLTRPVFDALVERGVDPENILDAPGMTADLAREIILEASGGDTWPGGVLVGLHKKEYGIPKDRQAAMTESTMLDIAFARNYMDLPSAQRILRSCCGRRGEWVYGYAEGPVNQILGAGLVTEDDVRELVRVFGKRTGNNKVLSNKAIIHDFVRF